MGLFDYFKQKVSAHNYDSDYVNRENGDDGSAPGNFFVEDRYEDISFSHPLSVLYHKKTELPFIDKNGRIWLFSDSDYFQSSFNDLCGDLWETIPSEIYIKVYEPDEIFPFLETCFYLYGMDTASLNFEKNIINIKKYVKEIAYKYDPSNPNYEISNPVFRYNSVYYNQILQTEFNVQNKLSRLNKLLSKSAKALFGSMLYCPYNMDGNVYSENMVIETEKGRFICIYSDAEAVGNMAQDTTWRCDRITFADAVKKAFYQSSSMLINYHSCAIVLTCDDVKYYASELNSDVKTEDEGLDGSELYQKAIAFKDENNYDEYKRLLNKSADSGYAIAQNELGFMYLNGDHCEKDIDSAIKNFDASLSEFDSSAMALAEIYKNGNGVEQNNSKALYYYKVASALGNADAMLTVGIMTLKGIGTEPDADMAFSYIKKSADNGNATAAEILAGLSASES